MSGWGWVRMYSMLDNCCLLLSAFLFLLLLLLVVGCLTFGYFWLLLVTGTGIRIQNFCFWGGE